MAKPRPKTSARRAKSDVFGVARRSRVDAERRDYTYKGKRPDKDAEYVLDGVTHLFNGKCHEGCENVR